MAARPSPPRLRRDAAHNRERILTAARELFATVGVHVPVEEIARAAGVGVGTVYRRFPDRTELVEAVFLERSQACLDVLAEALARDDAWDGFCHYVTSLCAMQAKDQAILDALTLTLPVSPTIQRVRTSIFHQQSELIRRAKRGGRLRQDFAGEDIVMLLIANGAIINAARGKLPNASSRFVALNLDALTTERPSQLPPPPTPDQLLEALQRPLVNLRTPQPPDGRAMLPLHPAQH